MACLTRQREKKFISRFELLFTPEFNNAETKKSALSIPRTFSCALDTFLEKNTVFVFVTFIKFSCEK